MIDGQQFFTATLSSPNATSLGASIAAVVTVMDNDNVNSDFSAPSDGKRDILWRNTATGDTRAWLMNHTALLSSIAIPGYGTDWTLAGTGDFNADGHSDILWRNKTDLSMKIAYMAGTDQVTATGTIATLPDANFVVVGVGDMNSDGFPDIIWRNTSTFEAYIWLMRDATHLSTASLPTVADAGWQLIGLGDFTRDGKNDLVWRHAPTTKLAIWMMNGTSFNGATFLPNVGAPWLPVGVGDMNGDGDADLLWQTTTTRQLALWQMNQTAFDQAYFIDTAGDSATANDPAYQVVAPR